MKINWNNARFVRSSVWPEHYPPICNKLGKPLEQVAFVGRSNVGKSSLINSLLSTRQLAKVSSTPGKTQLINFFCVDEALFFVDLPGYGFAKCPLSVKKEWDKMISLYFDTMNVSLLIFLLDIRRIPNDEDFKLLEWASFRNIPLQIVLTKIDKCSKTEREKQSKKILPLLPSDAHIVYHSSKTLEGNDQLRKCILAQGELCQL